MTRHEFDGLVRRLDARYSGRPTSLSRSATAWVALGLAAVPSWLGVLFLLGATFFAVGAKQGPGPAIFLIGMGAALLVYASVQAGLFLALAGSDIYRR